MYIKVEEDENLVRDTESNAILNVNPSALQAYKNRKKQSRKIDNLEEKIEKFDDRLLNIENLLISLKNKLK